MNGLLSALWCHMGVVLRTDETREGQGARPHASAE